MDDSEQTALFTRENVVQFELTTWDWLDQSAVVKHWSNVVSIKVCSQLCFQSNKIDFNSWTFDSVTSECSCINLAINYQCRQWFGKAISDDTDQSTKQSIFVMGSKIILKQDCTGVVLQYFIYILSKLLLNRETVGC